MCVCVRVCVRGLHHFQVKKSIFNQLGFETTKKLFPIFLDDIYAYTTHFIISNTVLPTLFLIFLIQSRKLKLLWKLTKKRRTLCFWSLYFYHIQFLKLVLFKKKFERKLYSSINNVLSFETINCAFNEIYDKFIYF